jgi:predicted ATPase
VFLPGELFLPFVARLEARCATHWIDSPVDYRLLAASEGNAGMRSYYEPLGCAAAGAALAARWAELSKGAAAAATTVRLGGRAVRVERAVVQGGGDASHRR